MQEKSKSNTFRDSFQELLNFIPDSIIILNKKGVVLAANEALSIFLGETIEELIGKRFDELKIFDEKTKSHFKKQLERKLQRENLESSEVSVLLNGETRYFDAEDKKIDYFGETADLIIFHNVTEQRKRQCQLQGKIEEMDEHCQESEGLFVKLFQESTDAIFLADAETGMIIDCNAAASLLVARDHSELVGQYYSILRDQTLGKADSTQLEELVSVSSNNSIETQIVAKTGQIKHVSLRLSFFEFKGKKLIQGTLRDVTEHKLMQQALQENEEKFHGIASSVRDAIVLVNEEAKITYWNPSAEKIFGYLNSEVIGKNIHELVVPNTLCKEGKERVDLSVKTFAETGTGYFTVGSVELVGRRKDGTEFPAELSISPIKLGGKWSAVGAVKDVTGRKQAEEKIREAEQRYHALFNQSPVGVLVVDPETCAFTEFNDIAYLQLGYSIEEFSKLRVFDIDTSKSPDETKSHLTLIAKEGGGEFETTHHTKKGEIRNILVTARTIDLPGKMLLHCIFHDITEIRRTQASLIESEARYRQLVELAQAGIWAIDNDYTTVFVNPRMAEMLGYLESELIRKSLFDFIDQTSISKIREIMDQFNGRNTKGQFEYTFPRKDGTYINTSLAVSAITNDQGQITGSLALVADITERKRLEDELRASEERFRAISTSAMDAIILVDTDDKVLYWNPAAEKTFGFTEKEALGKKLVNLVIPAHGQAKHSVLLQELRSNTFSKSHFEFTALRKDGSKFPMDLSVASVKLRDKNCLLAIARDVSERKSMEEALKQERDMLEDITENIGAGLVIVDKDYQILWANSYSKNLNGQVGGKTCFSTFNKLAEICPNCGPKKIFEGAPFDSREYFNENLHEKGLPSWFELIATPIKDKDGKVVAALELTVDITEKKELEGKIREERNKLEAITENISASLMLVDKEYQVIWQNKFAKQLYGEITNQKCFLAIYGQNSLCSDCGVKKVFDGSASDVHEANVTKNNDTKSLKITSTPMKDKDGNIIGVLELGMDITEIKKMQGELSRYSQKLEELVERRTEQLKQIQAKLVKSERLAAIGELAGMIGHDLRNPLTGIKNSAYFLKKKGNTISEVQAKEMLETIDKCVDYSNKIVNDLLDYSREINLERQDCSPRKLLLEVLSIINVPEKIEVLNQLPDGPQLKVDSNKIKRVFMNLVKNAIEAMSDVGKLTVDGKEVNGKFEISFIDTGPGIRDEVLPKLFFPLFTTKAQGMGFGLAICKRIIEAHGGSITVKTAIGEGTTFKVTLPIGPKTEIGGEKIWINVPESSLSTMTKP